MDDETKRDIALFRVAVLGPLVGAELEHGDIIKHCLDAAERRWEWPDGTLDTIASLTIRDWYYDYANGGFGALMPRDRKDLGTTHIRPELADLILRAKREKPRRSIKRIIKLLVRPREPRPASSPSPPSTASSSTTRSPADLGAVHPPSVARSSTSTPASSSSATRCTSGER